MNTLAHLIRGRVVDLIGSDAVDKLTAAGIALVDGGEYRRFVAQKQAEAGRLREIAAAAGRAAGNLTVRAELREEEGTVSCIVTHPTGDEHAVVSYLGHLLRAVVGARHGKAAAGDIGHYDVPAAFVPGPRFPEPAAPGEGTTRNQGLLLYGEAHYVFVDRLDDEPTRILMPGKHRHLHLQVGEDDAGVLLSFTNTEMGWIAGTSQATCDGALAPIPWDVQVRAAPDQPLQVHVDCPPGTPVAWVIQ